MPRGYPSSINAGTILLVVYVIFGFYFINSYFHFVDISKVIPTSTISNITGIINVIGGILLVIGGFNLLRIKKASNHYPPQR